MIARDMLPAQATGAQVLANSVQESYKARVARIKTQTEHLRRRHDVFHHKAKNLEKLVQEKESSLEKLKRSFVEEETKEHMTNLRRNKRIRQVETRLHDIQKAKVLFSAHEMPLS
jgi:hypothetical protein